MLDLTFNVHVSEVRRSLYIVKKKYWIGLIITLVILTCGYFLISNFVLNEPERRATDPDFILLENIVSANQQFRILVYHYDTGAFGYSRAFWAVTPLDYHKLNLADYELPDGYEAKGWSEQNELLVQKWEPYYYRQKLGELKTGD